ncbi:MAG: hypothetical protein DMF48_03655 [Verrucomicrobia bacterium]|nr:MAG: hypothetical protein DMF48_03655 [Verrucomicrobiota bacterium]
MEDTFDRLLERHTYDSLKSLFQAYFSNKHEALAAVCEDMTVPAMLERTGAVLLKNDEVMQDQLMCHHRAKWGMAFAPIDFEVYEKRKVRFSKNSDRMLADVYEDFRECFFEARRRQRRRRWLSLKFSFSHMKSTIPAHVYKSGPAVIGVDLISGVRPGSSYSMLVPLREMTKNSADRV